MVNFYNQKFIMFSFFFKSAMSISGTSSTWKHSMFKDIYSEHLTNLLHSSPSADCICMTGLAHHLV